MSDKILRILLIVFIVLVIIILLPHAIVYGIGVTLSTLIPILIILTIIVGLYKREQTRQRLMQETLTKLNAKSIFPLGSVISGLDQYPGKSGYLAISDNSLYFLSYYKSIICGEILKTAIQKIEVMGSSQYLHNVSGSVYKGTGNIRTTHERFDIYHLIITYTNANNATTDVIIEYEGGGALSQSNDLKNALKNEIGL